MHNALRSKGRPRLSNNKRELGEEEGEAEEEGGFQPSDGGGGIGGAPGRYNLFRQALYAS